MTGTEISGSEDRLVIRTGLVSLDARLNGGLQRGTVVEVSGPSGSGKSSLGLQLIEAARSQGLVTALFDMSYTYDLEYSHRMSHEGPHMYASPRTIGAFATACLDLCDTGAVDLIVVDDAAAAGIDEDAHNYDEHMSRIASAVAEAGACLVMLNQHRAVLRGFGKTTTPGGRLLKLYTQARIKLGRGEMIQSGGDHVGQVVFMKVMKREGVRPFVRKKYNLYTTGFDPTEDLVETALSLGVLERTGNWIKYQNNVLGNGLKATAERVRVANLWDTISQEVYNRL